MNPMSKLIKAIRDLGPAKLWLFALYQVGLRSGHYRRMTPSSRDPYNVTPELPPYSRFPQVSLSQIEQARSAGDEICRGYVRLFGGEPVPLNLNMGASSQHWTLLERIPPETDIKLIWEPARFGWAVTLARAYAYSGDPVYAETFWEKTLKFLSAHPPNLGRHWQSAQEVAIRLMVWVFCDRVLANAPSSIVEHRQQLWQAIAEHAARIPSTLVYARAQNNNHLLAEAAGLYTAGIYLPSHPQAKQWRKLGWHWLNKGFQDQITEFGTYVQHSVNYHRLMLQLAVYVDHLRREVGDVNWPEQTLARLAAATRWLWALTDSENGKAPNLGANDGAYLFPLSAQPWEDYRPVVSAAGRAFLGQEIYDKKPLTEMAAWFNLSEYSAEDLTQPQTTDILRVESGQGRGYLRAAQFFDRPSHADQLHVDLWWRGVNVALDPGTYQYNAAPPWDNALVSSMVHNIVVVDRQEQMSPVGRFLWLDWAQSEVLAHEVNQEGHLAWVSAEHNGYRKLGVFHQRKLSAIARGWLVNDTIRPMGKPEGNEHEVQVRWLLPDWDWTFDSQDSLHLVGPDFSLQLKIEGAESFTLIRAGESLYGKIIPEPTWGWWSPTYGVKVPALLLVGSRTAKLPLEMKSTWRFSN